jgi:hypothetical protein
MRVLVVDIGGNNVKLAVPGKHEVVKVPSGSGLTAKQMVTSIRRATSKWDFDVVSVGYPGPVVNGVPSEEPVNLGKGWVGFDFDSAFGSPVRFINDAAMQALGSYEGGRMLFLGLGTGLGTALVVDGTVLPLELAHLPFRKGLSYEQYVGRAGLLQFGRKRWREFVVEIVGLLKHAMQADYVVLGGGNVKELRGLPTGARQGANSNAMLGGVRLWEAPAWATPAVHPVTGGAGARRKTTKPAAARGTRAPRARATATARRPSASSPPTARRGARKVVRKVSAAVRRAPGKKAR